MNVLPTQKKLAVISALVEGNSIRSIERMFGVHRDTIMRLLVATGQHCQAILNERMRGLKVNRLELDEIWTFCMKKQKRVQPEENGDFWKPVCLRGFGPGNQVGSRVHSGQADA